MSFLSSRKKIFFFCPTASSIPSTDYSLHFLVSSAHFLKKRQYNIRLLDLGRIRLGSGVIINSLVFQRSAPYQDFRSMDYFIDQGWDHLFCIQRTKKRIWTTWGKDGVLGILSGSFSLWVRMWSLRTVGPAWQASWAGARAEGIYCGFMLKPLYLHCLLSNSWDLLLPRLLCEISSCHEHFFLS